MDSNIYETSIRHARESMSAFADEIEGELEKRTIFGVHITRRITLSILGLFAVTCIVIGVSFGVDFASSNAKNGIDAKVHRYWSLGETIESSVGKSIYDNTTDMHEALLWLAESDPLRLDASSPLEEILQRFVLANLYFATNGVEWIDQFNFFSKKNVCEWNDKKLGVFCNNNNQVSSIVMPACNLSGTIPHDIGLLSHMGTLNLTRNNLIGTIPVSLGIMSSLTSVDLSINDFVGPLPKSIAMLLDLKYLDLSNNALEGDDDLDALKNLPNLEELYLSRNNFQGNVGQIGSSESLRVIDLSYNSINGTMPQEFMDGRKLKILKLNNNEIIGPVPAGIGGLYNLVELDLSNNELTGSLPSALGDLISLQSLKLNSNKIQYGLPPDLAYLNDLRVLEITNNGIESIPKEMFYLNNLELLNLSFNHIVGSLPTEIGRLTSLVKLDFSHNQMSDEIPLDVSFLTALEYLYLNDNLFDGNIPSELSSLFLLRELDISNNKFFGSMNEQFCGKRPDWGNPIERYKADCLGGDIQFLCATECCDLENHCCFTSDEDCVIHDGN